MGTFDILNLRINGVDFNNNLLRGKGDAAWNTGEIFNVFKQWSKLKEYYSNDWKKLDHEDALEKLIAGEVGMYFVGGFILGGLDEEEKEKFGVFRFPDVLNGEEKGNRITRAVDAPIDAFVMAGKSKKKKIACDLLAFLASEDAFDAYSKYNSGFIGIHKQKSVSSNDDYLHDEVLQSAASILGSEEKITNYLDREMDNTFVKNVLIPKLEKFLAIKEPTDEFIARMLEKIQISWEPFKNSNSGLVMDQEDMIDSVVTTRSDTSSLANNRFIQLDQ